VLNDQFDLEVDASGFAVGAVLLQKKEDGKRHPVGYYSATLNEAERNYDIYNSRTTRHSESSPQLETPTRRVTTRHTGSSLTI
jgi:hypothetical protein